MFSNSFAGIAPASAPGFVIAQLIGAAIGLGIDRVLQPARVTEAQVAHTITKDSDG